MPRLGAVAFLWLPLSASLATAASLHQAALLRGQRTRAVPLGALPQEVPPPGDVSGIGDIAKGIHEATAGKGVKVAGDLGEMVSQDLTKAAKSAEAAIVDPVGTVGDAVDAAAESVESEWSFPTPAPEILDTKVPESAANVAGYSATPPTPPPAPFAGQYCRGSACQYRVYPFGTPPPLTYVGVPPPEEPCRGIGCPPRPLDPHRLAFYQNCAHLFSKAPGGLLGDPEARTIGDVQSTFIGVCKKAVPLLAASCPDWAEVIVAALAPDVREQTVGGVDHVCSRLFEFATDMQMSALQLGLAGPPPAPASMLLAVGGGTASAANVSVARLADRGQVGPCSPGGQRWRQWWSKRHVAGLPRPLSALQQSRSPPNAPCKYGIATPVAADMLYEVAPGSPDGLVPTFSVSGGLFTSCLDQMAEISLGYSQTPTLLSSLVKDWCGFQSLAANPKTGVPNHPEWGNRDCTVMSQFMIFATRADLSSRDGLGTLEVCKRMFLGLRTVSGVQSLVSNIWSGGRTPTVGGPPAAGPSVDPTIARLQQEAADKAKKAIAALKRVQAAQSAVSSAKVAVAKWRAR